MISFFNFHIYNLELIGIQRPGIIGGRADCNQLCVPGVVSYGRHSSFIVAVLIQFWRFYDVRFPGMFLRRIHFALEIIMSKEDCDLYLDAY
jgi:hypothetical protein